MARFNFRLSTLQKLREAHRDEMRSKLAEAYQAEQMLAERIQQVHDEVAELQNSQRIRLSDSTTNMNQLLDTQRYQAVLRTQIATMNGQSKMLADEVEKRRQALVEADQQVRVLEKLYERQFEAHQKETLRAEDKVLDEIASRSREVNF